ncbi:MAG: hypothetical protein M1835_003275 [Candelina submexicana]|nr:MAG: hypothetical protein M1835_003275 [Candelina submexicana]
MISDTEFNASFVTARESSVSSTASTPTSITSTTIKLPYEMQRNIVKVSDQQLHPFVTHDILKSILDEPEILTDTDISSDCDRVIAIIQYDSQVVEVGSIGSKLASDCRTLTITFLSTLFLTAKAWVHVNAQNIDTSTSIPKASTYVEWHPSWNRCETWQGIWQHTPTRIDQMVFNKVDVHEDFNIIMYKDDACANEIGYIPNASDGATVALTVNGNNNPQSLKKHDPSAN